MLSRKDIVFPILVLSLLFGITVAFPFYFSKDFVKYKNLKNKGVRSIAATAGKKEIEDKKFTSLLTGYKNHKYKLVAGYNIDGVFYKCDLSVSKTTFDSFDKRDELLITYNPSKPTQCSLPFNIELNYYILLSIMGVGFLFFLITLGFAYYVYKSFKKPSAEKLVATTTGLGLEKVDCPKCGADMTEGYLPTIGGICWRDKDDPVGIPTILSGLPGTTFWVKRPKLHAFHCKNCRIITFKYGDS